MIDEQLLIICESVTDPNMTSQQIAKLNGLSDYLLGERLPADIVDLNNNDIVLARGEEITRDILKNMVIEADDSNNLFMTKPQIAKVDNVIVSILYGDDPTGKGARRVGNFSINPNFKRENL